MSNKKFIVFYASEDGEHKFDEKTEEEIKKEYLSEEYPTPVFDKLPDIEFCGRGILIIDGKIVVPIPKKVVKDWSIG